MAEIDLDCCGPTEQTNPKKELFRRRTKKADHLFRLRNPIPEEIKDPTTLRKVFKNWNLIPFAGSTSESSHSLLAWYLLLANLSPTNSATIKKLIKYAVGGKVRIVRSVDPEFDTGEDVQSVTVPEAINYRDELKKFFVFRDGILKFHRRIAWQYKATGNAFVEMTVVTVNGETRIGLKAHKTTHCLYLNTKPGETKEVAVSPVWEDKYLEKNPPRVVPIYPVLARNDEGNLVTMFHLKAGENEWYGRPDSSGADIYKYREIQDAIYLVKAAASDFTGKLIVEVEDDDPEFAAGIEDQKAQDVGFEGFVDRWENNFTNKAEDPQSVVVSTRPYGSRPMFVFQISPNTKESWYQVTGKIAEEKIVRGHNCTLRFMGFDVASGFSTDVYLSDYLLNMEPVIVELHDEITIFTNSILTAGWSILGRSDLNEFSIEITSPIQSSIEQYKTGAGKTQAPQNPQPDQNPGNTEPGNTDPENDPNESE